MDTTDKIRQLTDREREILALVAKGRTNAEIGDALGLRFDTVKWYVSEILSKLGVDSREQAAEAWRESHRLGQMLERPLRALFALTLTKTGLGLAGTATAGGVVALAALSFDAGSMSEVAERGTAGEQVEVGTHTCPFDTTPFYVKELPSMAGLFPHCSTDR